MYAGRFGYPRWVGGGGCQQGGVDPGIGSDGYFDHTGARTPKIENLPQLATGGG